MLDDAMTIDRALAASAPFALTLVLACTTGGAADKSGAASTADSGPTAQASAAPALSAPPRPDARHHGKEPGGPAGTMFRATRELTLTEEQKAKIEALETQLEGADVPADDFKELQTDVVAGIRAGKLDKTKVQADFALIDKTMAAHEAKEAAAVSGLYTALDESQRKALVASIRAREAARDAQFAAHAEFDAGAVDWTKRRLDRLTAQLGLDPAQQKTVGALLVKGDSMGPAAMHVQREEGKKRMDGVLTAFEGDHFDPAKVDLGGLPGKTAHEGLEKDTTFLSQLLPVLTPEQREKLAAQREHTGMRHHGDMDEGRPHGLGLPPE